MSKRKRDDEEINTKRFKRLEVCQKRKFHGGGTPDEQASSFHGPIRRTDGQGEQNDERRMFSSR